MSYRPQYSYPPPPAGWVDEDFVYEFDSINTPALASPPQSKIPLVLQPDAEFHIRGMQISGNTGNLLVRFWSPNGYPLGAVPVECDRAYDSTVNGPSPIGRLPVTLEPEIVCPAGGLLLLDLELL